MKVEAENQIETENKENESNPPSSESATAKSNKNVSVDKILDQIGTAKEKLA